MTPLHYHNIVNKTKLIGVCLLVWAISSASALVRNVECKESSTLINSMINSNNLTQVDFFTAPSHLVYCGHSEENSDISSNSHQIASILHLVFLSIVPFVALIFIHIR